MPFEVVPEPRPQPGRRTLYHKALVHKSTDDACALLVPGSVSEAVTWYSDDGLQYYCRLSPQQLEGPFVMFCSRTDGERYYETLKSFPLPNNAFNNKGECHRLSGLTSVATPVTSSPVGRHAPAGEMHRSDYIPSPGSRVSTEIKAGEVGCVDSHAVESSPQLLEAYMTLANSDEQALARFISWTEVQPISRDADRQTNTDHLSVEGAKQGSIYRACALAATGRGNTRLSITSRLSFDR